MTKKCTEQLGALLTPNNACRLLELAMFFDETDQTEICMSYVQDNSRAVFGSKEFCEIQQSTLIHILKFSDVLSVSEASLCDYCVKWALYRLHCKQQENEERMLEESVDESVGSDSSQNQEAVATSNNAMKTGDDFEENDTQKIDDTPAAAKRSSLTEAIQTELGEALYQIRFPTMSHREFAILMNRRCKILDKKDEFEVYRCKYLIDTNQPVESKFKLTPRRGPLMIANVLENSVPQIRTSHWNQRDGFESIVRLVMPCPMIVESVLVAIPSDEHLQGCDVRIRVACTTDLGSDSVIRFKRIELDRDRVYGTPDRKHRHLKFNNHTVVYATVPLLAHTVFNGSVDVKINVIMEGCRDLQNSLLVLEAPYMYVLSNRARVLRVTTQDSARSPMLLFGIQTPAAEAQAS